MTPLNNLSIKDLDWPCLSDMDREPVYQRVAPITSFTAPLNRY